jgi:hypothetical protein
MLSEHVNKWLHHQRVDNTTPAETILQFNNLFLKQVQRLGLHLWCPEAQFRKNMCEALCTLYIAERQGTTWKGPLSAPKRPYGWTVQKERDWEDYMRNRLFTYELWQLVWCQIPQAYWETTCPYWREHFEHIATHYLMVHPDMLDETIEDSDGVRSYGDDSD